MEIEVFNFFLHDVPASCAGRKKFFCEHERYYVECWSGKAQMNLLTKRSSTCDKSHQRHVNQIEQECFLPMFPGQVSRAKC